MTPSFCEPEKGEPRRIIDPADLTGETIRTVIHTDGGKNVSMVIVFESDSWATLACHQDVPDEQGTATLMTIGAMPSDSPSGYLTADQLLEARLINRAQHEFLSKAEAEAEKKARISRANHLRQLAESLDPSTPTNS